MTEITYDPSNTTHPYVLTTARGAVRAAKILHATNGYSGHLLPGLRGKIYPLRGTMSTQKPPSAFGNHGREITWSRVGGGDFDPETKVFRNFDAGDGLQSNEFNSFAYAKGKNGEFYFGGINGLTVFHPDDIADSAYTPQVALISLTQDDQPLITESSVETLQAVTLVRGGHRADAQAVIDRIGAAHLQYHLQHRVGHPMERTVDALVQAGLRISVVAPDLGPVVPDEQNHRHH